MDNFDLRILKKLEMNAKLSLKDIGRNVGLFSPSAISKRISILEKEGYIKNYRAILDYQKLGYNFMTVTFIKAKYAPKYSEEIAKKLVKIKGVISVYFLLGDIDFVLITINKTKDDYARILDELTNIVEIERTDSRTVLKVFKEYEYDNILIEDNYS